MFHVITRRASRRASSMSPARIERAPRLSRRRAAESELRAVDVTLGSHGVVPPLRDGIPINTRETQLHD
jgi:hypothetical protein